MYPRKRITLLVAAFVFSIIPARGFSAELKKTTENLVLKLQNGKAKISLNKKSILDENDNIVASETSPPKADNKTSGASITPNKSGSTAPPDVVNCSFKCSIITRHCYADSYGSIVCINICDKETLRCD